MDDIERRLKSAMTANPASRRPTHRHAQPVKLSRKIQQRAAEVVARLDYRGAWVEEGRMRHNDRLPLIDMGTYADHIETLAAYAGAEE